LNGSILIEWERAARFRDSRTALNAGGSVANSRSGESVAERIVRVLNTFSEERTMQTPTEIGRQAGLPTSTAHRMVDDLVSVGLLERDVLGHVSLGMKMWELAHRGSRALRLREAARPYMAHAQSAIREHTQLAVLEDGEALFIERLSDPRAGLNVARVAGRLPLHASSSGLVLLAYAAPEVVQRVLAAPLPRLTPHTMVSPERILDLLATVRSQGHVIAPGYVSEVSTGVAVPVRHRGRVVAALSMVLPRDDPRTARVVSLLVAAAEGIGLALAEPQD
jgi:DNA-binding IclR family transcriptional regulator